MSFPQYLPKHLSLNWKINQNTNTGGLRGIYSAIEGDTPCATKFLKAVSEEGRVVAFQYWETLGNEYRYAQKAFGDQLEQNGFARMGY